MRFSRLGAVLLLTTGLVGPLALAPADAATRAIVDDAGDAGGARKLDITRVRVSNNAAAVVVRVTFARVTAGDLIVSLDPRADKGVRLVAQRSRSGDVTSRVLPGAFTDRGPLPGGEPCTSLRVRWERDVARLTMPARCLNAGDYEGIRFAVLTENGSDSDFAPETRRGDLDVSQWVPRG